MAAGRKSFEPTDQQRRMAESLAGCGTRQDAIARIMGIDAKTLRKYFRHELACGSDKAIAQVAGSLFKMAISGDCVAATIFFLKTRGGWTETSRAQQVSGDGPLSINAARKMLAKLMPSRPKEDDDEEPITG